MSDIIAYSHDLVLAQGTLAGNQINWTSPSGGRINWSQCDALELRGSVHAVWFAVSGVSLDRQQFPEFTIQTAFVVIADCTLSQSRGNWTINGDPQDVGQASFQMQLALNVAGNLQPANISPVASPGFTCNPGNFTLSIPAPANVHVDFQRIGPSSAVKRWSLRYRTTAASPGKGFWAPFPAPGSANYNLQLAYLTPSGTVNPQPFMEVAGFDPVKMAQYWSTAVAGPYLAGVRVAETDSPLSLLMTIEPPSGGGTPLIWVYRAVATLTVDAQFNRTVAWYQGCFSAEGSCALLAQDFITHDTTPLALNAVLDRAYPSASLPITGTPWPTSSTPVFVFVLAGLSTTIQESVRLGALDLTFGPGNTLPNLPGSVFTMLGYLDQGPAFWPSGPTMVIPRLALSVQLKVAIQVGSQDAIPTSTSSGDLDLPIVVPLSAAAGSPALAPPQNQLQIYESNLPVFDYSTGRSTATPRTVNLSLLQPYGNSGPASLLILDRTPFLVARVNLPSLLGNGSSGDGVVAEWSNSFGGGGGWQSQSGAQAVTLLLPPQGVGEVMERNRDIPLNAPIDYRFSPAAQIQIAPPQILDSNVGYYEAPWNVRRLLTTPGQNVPGALLPSFTAEFLYGLSVIATSTQLRLAELSALTGRLAPAIPDQPPGADIDPAYVRNQKFWQNILNTYQTRLAALVPWDGANPGSLSLATSVQYSLRSGADLAYPATTGPQAGATPYPKPQNGLKGGVGWIFENEGDYTSIWKNPLSTSALLADPVFSALGGWAKQRAVFLNGSITLNSHVEMGRTSTFSMEVLGRIGVFWNQAKHVIVYERTVQPSLQFENGQDSLLGRPLIRKVEEYIEILQPVRQYPESGGAPIKAAVVEAAEFRSKIIYIDSGWGSIVPIDPNNQGNIAQNGWRVPLWKKGADPFVYPKPHITLELSVDPATGNDTQTQEIAEPEKVFFYQTTSAGPNPDVWQAVPLVDFDDVDTSVSSNQPYRLSVNPGFGAFTWKLQPGAFPSNVVANRGSASPISASLKNVSMMRSAPAIKASPAPKASPVQALKAIPDRVVSLFDEIGDAWQGSVKRTITQSDLPSYFSGLNSAISTAFPQAATSVKQIITNSQSALVKMAEGADDYLTQVKNQFEQALNTSPPPSDAEIAALAQAQQAILDYAIQKLKVDPSTITKAQQQLQQLNHVVAMLQSSPNDWGLTALVNAQQAVAQYSRALAAQLSVFQPITATTFSPGWVNLATLESRLANPIGALLNGTGPQVCAAIQALRNDIGSLTNVVNSLTIPVLTLDPASTTPLSSVGTVRQAYAWLEEVEQLTVATAVQKANQRLNDWITQNTAALAPAQSVIQSALTTAGQSLQNVILSAEQIAKQAQTDFTSQLDSLQAEVQLSINGFLEAGKLFAGDTCNGLYSTASSDLNLLRAFGAPPIADGLSFALTSLEKAIPCSPALQNIAYFFDSTLPQVPITLGVQTMLSQGAQSISQLLPVNLTVPVSSLLDRLVPNADSIKNMLFSGANGIFQNLAGMDLGSLFAGLVPPLNTPDCIQIRHSINPQTLRVEVQADIDIPFTDDVDIFNEGPIYLRLLNAEFHATVTLQAGAGQQTVETVTGSIGGNWELQIAGLSLVTFVNTSLTFDQSGHIQFNISPERVRLASVMQFIADLINSFIPEGSGLTVTFQTAPVAVVCNLDLPMPDIAGGVFAISNLRLGALFSLGVDQNDHFQFTVGMNLCSMEAPFALVVFILGGGGWIESQLTYTPGYGSPEVQVQIGISAIAALEIALGPISGGVMISFSLFAQYDSSSTLDIGIVIVVAGHVDLLDIVDADITLMLEADYSGGRLTGRGSVSVDIKICWCFTLSIHEEVEYSFGNAAGGGGNSARKQVTQMSSFLAALPAPQIGTVLPMVGNLVSGAISFGNTSAPDSFWDAAGSYVNMLAA